MNILPFARPTIDEATIQRVVEVLRSGWLASGPRVLEFESGLSAYLGGAPVRTVTSGTEALEIALRVAGVGAGDEVITPAMSWCSTANVILRVGARPMFVDVDLDTRNIDLTQVEAAITPRTRAIMPVHFGGMAIDLDRLNAIATRHTLRVVEDAAHAIGTRWRGRLVGSQGDLVCFSFHPNKNLTTGEGGAIVARTAEEVELIERHRFNGIGKSSAGDMDVLFAGAKANMSDICAAIGLGQLAQLDQFNRRRHELASRYHAQWQATAPLRLPAIGDDGHSWHMFAALLPLPEMKISRRVFIERVRELGVALGIHYPAIHLFSAYRQLGYREGQFPNAERIGRETVTLPLFPSMSDTDVDRTVAAIDSVMKWARR